MNRKVNGEFGRGELIPGGRNTEAGEQRVCSGNKEWSSLAETKAMCKRVMAEKAGKEDR